jgi:hypothetical protein
MGLFGLRGFLDSWDERLARRLQVDYGRKRWVLSWSRRPDGGWRAQLSSPDWPRTTAAPGRTRCEAIRRADLALRLIRSRGAGPGPRS